MSQGATTPWNTLSEMIQKKVGDIRARHQKAEDEQRDNQIKIIMSGVQSQANNGTLTDEMIQQAQQQMQKLTPKDAHPLFDAYHKVVSMVSKKKAQAKQQGGGGQQGQPGQGQAQPQPGQPQSAGASGGGQPVQTAQPSFPTSPAPAKPQMFPSAADIGTAAGTQANAQEKVLREGRQQSFESSKQWYQSQGKEMGKDDQRALEMWAITGHFPPASVFGKTKMHPVNVVDADGNTVPGLQIEEGEDTGKVIGPDGQQIDNPKVLPKWKPRVGWAKDNRGKFYSFAIDPANNQPIKGTEDYNSLPPSSYLEHFKQGTYQWTDDSGIVHSSPIQSVSGVSVPSNGKATGAPGVPPHMRGPAPSSTKSGASNGKASSTGGGRILGSKDTGVLSPQAQKVIETTQPVIEQVDRLVADIDRLKLQDNNTSGYLFTSRLKYSMGKASPEGTLGTDIAGLSLGSVVEAANALQGSSRSIQALKKALVHTPNAWVDSPKLIREKLNTIKDRLNDVVKDADKYGRKRQTSTLGPSSGSSGGGQQLTPDQEAERYLATH